MANALKQERHRPDLVDFGRELDGSEDAHESALRAMEYLQTDARRSLNEGLKAMEDV